MKATRIVLGGALVLALAGTAVAQQQSNTPTQNPAVYGSPGMQEGGGYRQGSINNQRGYPQGGQMVRGAYNPAAGRNGLTPTQRLPGKNPFGTGARGGGMRLTTGITAVSQIHHN